MSLENSAGVDISDELHARITGYIVGLNTDLLPLLKNLSLEQRRSLFKLGEKNISFLNKNSDYAHLNPELVPQYMDVPVMARNIKSNERLTVYERQLQPVMGALDDTIVLTGSEALQAAMQFYHHVKLQAANGVSKAKSIYEDLASRFPGAPRRRSKVPTPAE